MYFFIGASLSKPHIDHDNGLRARNNGMYYVSMYHLPHVCRTLVPEIRVRPEILHISQYNVAHVSDLQLHVLDCEQQG